METHTVFFPGKSHGQEELLIDKIAFSDSWTFCYYLKQSLVPEFKSLHRARVFTVTFLLGCFF